MKLAIRIDPDGTSEDLDLDPKSYPVMSAAVGGMIERLPFDYPFDVWCNEEYRYIFGDEGKNNRVAEILWFNEFGQFNEILGSILVTGGVDDEGDTLGLAPEQAAAVRLLVAEFGQPA